MSWRRVQWVLLCEDHQHDSFVRRFLAHQGIDRRKFEPRICPPGEASAEAWVRREYVRELRILRSRPHVASGLIVVTDTDHRTYAARLRQLADACAAAGLVDRTSSERVAVFLPARNIETWLAFLAGHVVDETTCYPRLERERDCRQHVLELKRRCDAGALGERAPASLQAACEEFRTRIRGAD